MIFLLTVTWGVPDNGVSVTQMNILVSPGQRDTVNVESCGQVMPGISSRTEIKQNSYWQDTTGICLYQWHWSGSARSNYFGRLLSQIIYIYRTPCWTGVWVLLDRQNLWPGVIFWNLIIRLWLESKVFLLLLVIMSDVIMWDYIYMYTHTLTHTYMNIYAHIHIYNLYV